jgi:hypothetical protein
MPDDDVARVRSIEGPLFGLRFGGRRSEPLVSER